VQYTRGKLRGDRRCQGGEIITEVSDPSVNMDVVKLEKAPKMAVYSPKNKLPWDDAVTLVLKYAEIPYDVVYDEEVIRGDLPKYDWLHLHHEDFTGQYSKFYGGHSATRNGIMMMYEDQEALAHKLGFKKVSQMKLAVAQRIRDFCAGGGFLVCHVLWVRILLILPWLRRIRIFAKACLMAMPPTRMRNPNWILPDLCFPEFHDRYEPDVAPVQQY
jgi:hypothetical protein